LPSSWSFRNGRWTRTRTTIYVVGLLIELVALVVLQVIRTRQPATRATTTFAPVRRYVEKASASSIVEAFSVLVARGEFEKR
jgi:hypothetical protein